MTAVTLAADLERIRGLLGGAAGQAAAAPAAGAIAALADRFALTTFERDVIALAGFAELEPDAGELLAVAQGDPRLRHPTVALALGTLPDAHWSAFSPARPLRRFQLVELEGPTAVARAIRLPERVLLFLVGVDAPDEELLLAARTLEPPDELPPSAQAVAADLAERIAPSGSATAAVIALCGADRSARASVAAAAAAARGSRAFLMASGDLPASGRERALLARAWSREARLSDAVLVLDASDTTNPAESQAVAAFASATEAQVVVLSPEPIPVPHRQLVRLDLPRPPADEQRAMWGSALGPLAGSLNGTVERLASHFSLGPQAIAAVAAEVRRAASTDRAAVWDAAVWSACRRQARPRLDELAQRIDCTSTWNDLVLPARQLETLRMLAAQVRRRSTVYERWGFGQRGARGLGINALFAGASGTGKTLAAEILGQVLELDVYRIDLSAVVSKWIGETEKNLRRVFDAAEDGCAVLLFDEADALFGRRSEVKDSHDRYANIEVSYLLQRMEAYRGLAILTTNMKNHIDDAFLRRIRFVVDFPFPTAVDRCEIWRRAFPGDTPTEGLDWDRLAQLNIAGGSIRNVAIGAAFLAADAGRPVGMEQVRAAARIEYDKLAKPLTNGELRGWPAGHGDG